MTQPSAASLDFLTDEIEVHRSPIPAYTEHIIVQRLLVTTAVDTGVFYGYPDTPDVRKNYSLMQKLLKTAYEEAPKAQTVDPRPGQVLGVKARCFLDTTYFVF